MNRDFWRNSRVAVIGGGSWGTVLAHLASSNCREVALWVRDEERVRDINSTRFNSKYLPDLKLKDNLKVYSDLERVFDKEGVGAQLVIWALPSKACREQAKQVAHFFRGDELIIHATKGVEEGSIKRISTILAEEIPCRRIGVLSGPNLAKEIARGEPAATVVASRFNEVVIAGQCVLSTAGFRVYNSDDVVGVEWAGTLKNILAIASGCLDALGLGWNSRSMLISRGLAEMIRFGTALGGRIETFTGLAGVGDLMATCSSPLSRNYRVGYGLAKGEKLTDVLKDLGGVAEGVRTAETVWQFAQSRDIPMPITQKVYEAIWEKSSVKEALHSLMTMPQTQEFS